MLDKEGKGTKDAAISVKVELPHKTQPIGGHILPSSGELVPRDAQARPVPATQEARTLPLTADKEFMASKHLYLAITGRKRAKDDDVISYRIF